MDAVPNRPTGSVIEYAVDADGVVLSWFNPTPGPARFGAAAFLSFWLCGWAVGWAAAVTQLVRGPQPFLMFWLGGWTVGGGFAMWTLWSLLRPSRPESVRLEEDALRYDPGRTPQNPWQRNEWGWTPVALQRPRPAVWVERTSIHDFVLDRVGERQRLCFDRDADRIEIGAELREPEREWLFAVLRRWHAAESHAPFVPADFLGIESKNEPASLGSPFEPPEWVAPVWLVGVAALALALMVSCVGLCLLTNVR